MKDTWHHALEEKVGSKTYFWKQKWKTKCFSYKQGVVKQGALWCPLTLPIACTGRDTKNILVCRWWIFPGFITRKWDNGHRHGGWRNSVSTILKRNEEWVQEEDVSTLLKERRQRRVRSAVKLAVDATGRKKSLNRCDSASGENPEKRP